MFSNVYISSKLEDIKKCYKKSDFVKKKEKIFDDKKKKPQKNET